MNENPSYDLLRGTFFQIHVFTREVSNTDIKRLQLWVYQEKQRDIHLMYDLIYTGRVITGISILSLVLIDLLWCSV